MLDRALRLSLTRGGFGRGEEPSFAAGKAGAGFKSRRNQAGRFVSERRQALCNVIYYKPALPRPRRKGPAPCGLRFGGGQRAWSGGGGHVLRHRRGIGLRGVIGFRPNDGPLLHVIEFGGEGQRCAAREASGRAG